MAITFTSRLSQEDTSNSSGGTYTSNSHSYTSGVLTICCIWNNDNVDVGASVSLTGSNATWTKIGNINSGADNPGGVVAWWGVPGSSGSGTLSVDLDLGASTSGGIHWEVFELGNAKTSSPIPQFKTANGTATSPVSVTLDSNLQATSSAVIHMTGIRTSESWQDGIGGGSPGSNYVEQLDDQTTETSTYGRYLQYRLSHTAVTQTTSSFGHSGTGQEDAQLNFEVEEDSTVTGSGTPALPSLSTAGTGEVRVSGSGTPALPALETSGSAWTSRSGSGSLSLPALTAAGTGSTLPDITGSGTLALGPMAVATAGVKWYDSAALNEAGAGSDVIDVSVSIPGTKNRKVIGVAGMDSNTPSTTISSVVFDQGGGDQDNFTAVAGGAVTITSGGADGRVEMWFYDVPDLVAAGTYTIRFTYTGTGSHRAGAHALWDTKSGQPEAVQTTSAANVATISPTITTLTANAMVIEGIDLGQGRADLGPDDGQVERYQVNNGSDSEGAGSTNFVGIAGSTDTGWSWTTSVNRVAHVAISVAPIAQVPAAATISKQTVGHDDKNAGIQFDSYDAGATEHDVYAHTASMAGDPEANGTLIADDADPTASHFWTDRTGGTTYYFQAVSRNAFGDTLSNEVSFKTAPKRPTGISANPGTNYGEIDVTFTNPATTEAGIRAYYRAAGSSDTWDVEEYAADITSLTLTGVDYEEIRLTAFSLTDGESGLTTAVTQLATGHAVGAVTLPALTVSGTTTTSRSGSGSLALQPLTVVGSGSNLGLGHTGSGTPALQPLTVTAAGVSSRSGSGALSLQVLVITGPSTFSPDSIIRPPFRRAMYGEL